MNISDIKNKFLKYSKVFENYFFMTLLPVGSTLIGLLIYPFLIRKLGPDSYGIYPFAMSIVSYFTVIVSFGFGLPGVKKIIENKNDLLAKNQIISSVFTAKSLLLILTTILFIVCIIYIPKLQENKLIYIICYTQIVSELFFPVWYFQAIQKMRIVTSINLIFRVLTIPFIFIFIQTSADLWIYALIVSISVILGSITSVIILWKREGIILKFVSISSLRKYFREAIPFFWSSSAGTIKQESVNLIIGSFFGMRDVALYDLANKIITIPRMLTNNINGALYPQMIEKNEKSTIKKIIRYEIGIGLIVIFSVLAFGYWIVLIFGGNSMLLAYPLTVILSTTILTWLVVGCYINFVFIPQNRCYFVSYNQTIAFITFFLFCGIGMLLFNNIYAVVTAIALSGFCEIIYCNYIIRKNRLL